ncbi:MAG: 1,4-alpha-glucan branching protein domain-containing protein, partial [Microcoleaceae cyanobacterium]
IQQDQIDAGWLEKLEMIDNIFPEINYRVYRPITRRSIPGR